MHWSPAVCQVQPKGRDPWNSPSGEGESQIMSEGVKGQRGVDKCLAREVRPELTRRRVLVASGKRKAQRWESTGVGHMCVPLASTKTWYGCREQRDEGGTGLSGPVSSTTSW